MRKQQQYDLVAKSLAWLAEHQIEQPDLERLAGAMGVSSFHLQHCFQRWAGVSPKQFLKSLTRQAALDRLLSGSTVLDAALDAGLSGPGRLHDLMISTEGMTPGQVRDRGTDVALDHGIGQTPFGDALISWSERGICFLGFCSETGRARVSAELAAQWTNASFRENSDGAQQLLDRVFNPGRQRLRLCLKGSPFQLRVWEALLRIPAGTHVCYGQIARMIGQDRGSRAVGAAVGKNPVAWVIPCHRVIRQIGALGGYRWGAVTKQAMIGYEVSTLDGKTPRLHDASATS